MNDLKLFNSIAVKYGFRKVIFDKSLQKNEWGKCNVLESNKCIRLNPNLTYEEFKKHYKYKIEPKQLFTFVMLHEIGHFVLNHYNEEISCSYYKNATNIQEVDKNWITMRKKQEKEAWKWAYQELEKYSKEIYF